MPKIKAPKRRQNALKERREPETRENYKKWPTTSLLVTGLTCGAIFFVASNVRQIDEETDMSSLVIQLMFLELSLITFFPALLVLFILFCLWVLKALRIRIPKWVLKKCPLLYRFQREASLLDDGFLERENKHREYYGQNMLELESSDAMSDTESEDLESDEEVWTTHNHHQSDPEYQYAEVHRATPTANVTQHVTDQDVPEIVVESPPNSPM